MDNEKSQAIHHIANNKLVRYVNEEDYEPLQLRVNNERKVRMDAWLKYVALALVLESVGIVIDVHLEPMVTGTWMEIFLMVGARSLLSVGSVLCVMIAFSYLMRSRRSKIMKDIRNHELL